MVGIIKNGYPNFLDSEDLISKTYIMVIMNKKDRLKYTPRKEQYDILNFFVNNIDKNYFFVDAPVGIGKSYAAVMIGEWYSNRHNKNAKIDIVTNSKILQRQYVDDFPFMASLTGKQNYTCNRWPESTCEEGSSLNKLLKTSCDMCPYDKSRIRCENSDYGLMNFHLFSILSMADYGTLKKRDASLLIVDECHLLEEVFSNFLKVVVSKKLLTSLKLNGDEHQEYINMISNFDQLVEYLQVLVSQLVSNLYDLNDQIKEESDPVAKVKLVKLAQKLDRNISKFNVILKEQDNLDSHWVLDIDKSDESEHVVRLEPMWARDYMWDFIWSKYDKIVFMSGTILSKRLFSYLMGVDPEKAAYFSIDSPFPVENRKIYFRNVGSLSYKNKRGTYPKVISEVRNILDQHKNEKGIIHTTNYEIADLIRDNVRDPRLIIPITENREEALQRHINDPGPTVLISPSMGYGIDLKNDLSRFQVIIKVPFPSLGDKKIGSRLRLKPDWYQWRTLVDIIQYAGRSVRNMEDWAVTYVLDESFWNLIRRNNLIVPKYFMESVEKYSR